MVVQSQLQLVVLLPLLILKITAIMLSRVMFKFLPQLQLHSLNAIMSKLVLHQRPQLKTIFIPLQPQQPKTATMVPKELLLPLLPLQHQYRRVIMLLKPQPQVLKTMLIIINQPTNASTTTKGNDNGNNKTNTAT